MKRNGHAKVVAVAKKISGPGIRDENERLRKKVNQLQKALEDQVSSTKALEVECAESRKIILAFLKKAHSEDIWADFKEEDYTLKLKDILADTGK